MHALVPGGGPSLDGTRWLHSEHPKHRRRKKRYLADVQTLGRLFRNKFVRALERLHRKGELQLEADSPLQDFAAFKRWCGELAEAWNVYIEAPPPNARPEHALKYLARYMSGGPISDGRLISHEEGRVTFWARDKSKQQRSRPYELSGCEFTRRWSLHILPKGFTRSRCYGGFSSQHRVSYLAQCLDLLPPPEPHAPDPPNTEPEQRACPHC